MKLHIAIWMKFCVQAATSLRFALSAKSSSLLIIWNAFQFYAFFRTQLNFMNFISTSDVSTLLGRPKYNSISWNSTPKHFDLDRNVSTTNAHKMRRTQIHFLDWVCFENQFFNMKLRIQILLWFCVRTADSLRFCAKCDFMKADTHENRFATSRFFFSGRHLASWVKKEISASSDF